MAIDWLRLFPIYWVQNYPTCEKWDSVLNAALDEFEPVKEKSGLTTDVGPFTVWTGNWPYCYGAEYRSERVGKTTLRRPKSIVDVLPKVGTRRRLRRMIREREERIQREILHLAILEEWREENQKRFTGN